MASKVVEENEVSINGIYYPISRPVQAVLASLYPAKVTIGDTTRDLRPEHQLYRGLIGVVD